MARDGDPLGDRTQRQPLVVQVVTDPALADCWSVNISLTGIGLVAQPTAAASGPSEGQAVELTLILPGSDTHIQVRGIVAWRHDGPRDSSLGIRFTAVGGDDRLAISRYLERYRFHVAVTGASQDEQALVAGSLSAAAQLHFADTSAAITELAARGDIAAHVVFGTTTAETLDAALLPFASAKRAEAASPLADFAPRVIVIDGPPAATLLRLFNEGRLFRVLPNPTPLMLRQTIIEACSHWGLRTEQHRAALALQRTLQREQVQRGPGHAAALSDRLIYASAAFAEVVEQVRTVAGNRIGVLLQGETGTGKEVLARAIHDLSEQAGAPFVVQDCGTLTETLLESELFGHVKGAFTGAASDHVGLFVLASGGTVFLDEIENTTPSLQAKLLRVIETGQVRPVGSSDVRHVDVRVIAAANRDLEAEIAANRMRPDLYYRLAAFPIVIPPLRSRRDDILPLARHFLLHACAAAGRPACGLSQEAEGALTAHDWPGNARELRNAIERAVVLTPMDDPVVDLRKLPPVVTRAAGLAAAKNATSATPSGGRNLRTQLETFERLLIHEALLRHGGVVRQAARELGESPVTLARRARRLGLLSTTRR